MSAWWQMHRALAEHFEVPVDHALAAGFSSDRLGYAFGSGYQCAGVAMFPAMDGGSLGAFCATGSGGVHPRAIETGRAMLEPVEEAGGATEYTVVHSKVGDEWLMASVRDRLLETPANVRSAADLEWLVGDWIAEEHGVQTESTCRWIAPLTMIPVP